MERIRFFQFSKGHIRSGRAYSDFSTCDSQTHCDLSVGNFVRLLWISRDGRGVNDQGQSQGIARVFSSSTRGQCVEHSLNASRRSRDLVDANFVHIRGDARARLHTVNMEWCRRVTERPSCICAESESLKCTTATRRPSRTLPSCTCAGSNARHEWLRSGNHHGRGLCALAQDSLSQHELMKPGDYHRCGLLASARDSGAQYGLLQTGDHHGRGLRAPARDSIARHALLQPGDHH